MKNDEKHFAKALSDTNHQLVDLQVFVHALGFDPDKVVKFMSDCSDPMLRDFCLKHLKITIDEEQKQNNFLNADMKKISEWFYEQVKLK